MGKSQSKQIQEQVVGEQQIKQLSPAERWRQSDHKQQDLLQLIQSSSTLEEWSQLVNTFIRTIKHKQKYQSFLRIILQYLLHDQELENQEQVRSQLFQYYKLKLKNSFFIQGDNFEQADSHQSNIEKLFFLYGKDEQLIDSALEQNYPDIFLDFIEFCQQLIGKTSMMVDKAHLCKYILSNKKMEECLERSERQGKLLAAREYEDLKKKIQQIQKGKKLYLEMSKAFANFDNCEVGCLILQTMIKKQYEFTENQLLFLIKMNIYSMLLYDFGKFELNYNEIHEMELSNVLHYFYTNQTIEETHLLEQCFHIDVNHHSQFYKNYLPMYMFSSLAHTSTTIHIILKFYMQEVHPQFMNQLMKKVIASKCEVTLRTDSIIKIIRFHSQAEANVTQDAKTINTIQQFNVLLQIASVLYSLGINIQMSIIDQIYSLNQASLNRSEVTMAQDNSLKILRDIFDNYYRDTQKRNRSINLSLEEVFLLETDAMLKIVCFIRDRLVRKLISCGEMHQMMIQHMLLYQRYDQIKEILNSPDIIQKYAILQEAVELLILEHILHNIQNTPFKQAHQQLLDQFRIISIDPTAKIIHKHLSTVCLYKYIKYLEDRHISLTISQKQKIGIYQLYFIVDQYPEKIETIDFQALFCLIQNINGIDQGIFQSHDVPITDEFLKFKIYLSNKAFTLKKYKMANETINDVIQFEPPWISTELVKICKTNHNFEVDFLKIAFKFCAKGQDLQYILELFEETKNSKEKNQSSMRNSIKNLTNTKNNILSKFEAKKYTVINNDLIYDERDYRDYVADMTYMDDQLRQQKINLFFVLLGTDSHRAFHYSILENIKISFIFQFLAEGMKKNIFHTFNLIPLTCKYFYFYCLFKFFQRKEHYRAFKAKNVQKQDVQALKVKLTAEQHNTFEFINLQKCFNAFTCLKVVNQNFLQLYVQRQKTYLFIFDENYRKKIIIDLRGQPMGRSDILTMKRLCNQMKMDIIQPSLFALSNLINTSDEITEEGFNIIQKLITWTESEAEAINITQKLCQKLHSMQTLVHILHHFQEKQNQIYHHLITQQHLDILSSLAAIEIDQEFHGIVTDDFFAKKVEVGQKETNSMSEKHQNLIRRIVKKTNVFVLSKVMYFLYGMNLNVEKIVFSIYMSENQDEDMEQFDLLKRQLEMYPS